MGAKLTRKNQSLIIVRTNEDQEETLTSAENTNKHVQLSTTESNSKQTKKKKSKLDTAKIDKSTNTENCILPVSLFSEQLVDDKICTGVAENHIEHVPPADTQNGIVSDVFHIDNQDTSNGQNHRISILNNLTDATSSASSTITGITDEIGNHK
ncbi:unnamed protein product [Adineta ricciae]|uniref:Uncharacterized protein n=1 Tax=Adineta ricciae TaxID=249248 RepID=A0A814ZD90_ADIRI|nr:unnamed protein product [Adineta ricciae]CAF1241315.1 unnamed protein product [Adineta ricciae]